MSFGPITIDGVHILEVVGQDWPPYLQEELKEAQERYLAFYDSDENYYLDYQRDKMDDIFLHHLDAWEDNRRSNEEG